MRNDESVLRPGGGRAIRSRLVPWEEEEEEAKGRKEAAGQPADT